MGSGALDSTPLQFAVFRILSSRSRWGPQSISVLDATLALPNSHSVPKRVGIAIGKGKPKGGRKLAVRVTYEGSRLSAECLTKAYERLFPSHALRQKPRRT
jgi:hypothetical protein